MAHNLYGGAVACCRAALGLQAACRLLHTHFFCNDRNYGLSRRRVPAWLSLPLRIRNPKRVRDTAIHGPAMSAQPSWGQGLTTRGTCVCTSWCMHASHFERRAAVNSGRSKSWVCTPGGSAEKINFDDS